MSFLINPFTVTPAAATDPSFASVVQLAHFDGTNGSTTLTNSCPRGNTISANSATISTAQSVFGGASLRFTTGTGAVSGTHADYQFGTSDYTVEFAYRPDSLAGVNIFDMRNSVGNAACVTLYTLSNGTLVLFVSNADRITSATGVIVAATWHRIAVSKVSGTTRMFVNGTQRGSNFSDSINYNASALVTMGSWTGTVTNCYWDELRISNGAVGSGAGRYAANYTPATAAFPNS